MLFSGCVITTENPEKLLFTPQEMLKRSEARQAKRFLEYVSHIKDDIENEAHNGNYRADWAFTRLYPQSLIDKLQEYFTEAGFQVTQDKDEDGDSRLTFSWENAKEAA